MKPIANLMAITKNSRRAAPPAISTGMLLDIGGLADSAANDMLHPDRADPPGNRDGDGKDGCDSP